MGEVVYDLATDDSKRVQTEMGGKNPTVVAESADVKEAADIVANGMFGVIGQACTAGSRAIVYEEVYDGVVEAIAERANAIEIGPGDEYEMGPQVSENELQSTLEYIDIAAEQGATLAAGDEAFESSRLGDGYFVAPTVFSDVTPNDRIVYEEVFDPVLLVLKVEEFENAIRVANDVDYGLSSGILTQNHAEADRFVEEIEAGVAKINERTTGLEFHVSFGG